MHQHAAGRTRPSIEIPQRVTSLPPSSQPGARRGVSAVIVAEIDDPTAVGEAIEVVEQDAVQLESRRLRVRRVVVRLESSVLMFQSSNLPIRTRTRAREGCVAFVAFGPRASGTLNGVAVGPDRVAVGRAGIEAEFVVAAGYESVSFLLPFDELQSELRRRRRENEFWVPTGVEVLQPAPAAARELYDRCRRLVDVAARQPDVFELAQTQAVAETEVRECVLTTFGPPPHVESVPREQTRLARSRVVQVVEDYVLSNAADDLRVADLCEAAGVSERTLQYAFKEVMGMSPIAYLSRLRLHQVRKALRAATHRSTTVTKEALRWGFWHFGDFSRAYTNCFGELPSDTLRRQPDASELE